MWNKVLCYLLGHRWRRWEDIEQHTTCDYPLYRTECLRCGAKDGKAGYNC